MAHSIYGEVVEMTQPAMTPRQRRARRYAQLMFISGVASVTLFFVIQEPTPTGWRTPLLLVVFTFILGVTGIVFGALSTRYVWVVLNSVVMLSFPLFMVFGSLVRGP